MDRKRKRSSLDSEVEWTAARCQRLLRPIASRVAPLRRLAYITDPRKNGKDVGCMQPSTQLATPSTKNGTTNKSSDDPAWLSQPVRRPNSKSYSSKDQGSKAAIARYGGHAQGKPEDGLIALPTPFKARALRRDTPSKKLLAESTPLRLIRTQVKQPRRSNKDPFSRAPTARQSAELHDRQTFEKIFELHQGIVDGFTLLLKKTESPSVAPSSRKGPRSLFSTCLRRVPDYIQAEEEWRKAVDPDDETDVCAEVYEELAELSSSSSKGWPPLREVVRAHGIKLVRDIIRDRLVSSKTRAELANLPLQFGEIIEAEDLATAFAHSLPMKRPFDRSSALFHGCLSALSEVRVFTAEHKGQMSSAKLRILDSLYRSGKLRVPWLGTRDMTTTVSQAIRSLALSHTHSHHAVSLLNGLIVRVCQVHELPKAAPDRACKTIQAVKDEQDLSIYRSPGLSKATISTTKSLLTVLTAMCIISARNETLDESDRHNPDLVPTTILTTLAVTVLRNTGPYSHTSGAINDDLTLVVASRASVRVLASALLVQLSSSTPEPNRVSLSVGELVQGMNIMFRLDPLRSGSRTTLVEEVASYVCEVARCCGQNTSAELQVVLEHIVRSLMTQSRIGGAHGSSFLQQLALESARQFAKICPSAESNSFYEQVRLAVEQYGPLPVVALPVKRAQMQNATMRGGFRWEEGLCEWIEATPFKADEAAAELEEDLHRSPSVLVHRKKQVADPDESFSSCSGDDGLHDSGYISSLQETPEPRQKTLPISFSSPDVLAEGFRPSGGRRSPPDDAKERIKALEKTAAPDMHTDEGEGKPITLRDPGQASGRPKSRRRVSGKDSPEVKVASVGEELQAEEAAPEQLEIDAHASKCKRSALRVSADAPEKRKERDESDGERDELAMSARKRARRSPLLLPKAKAIMANPSRKAPAVDVPLTKAHRSRQKVADESEDELG